MSPAGPGPMPHAPAVPPEPRSTGGWTAWACTLALAGLLLWVSGTGRSPAVGDGLGGHAGWAWQTLVGGMVTFAAAAAAIGATVAAAVLLRGAARWAAAAVSTAVAVGALVALVAWYLPWLP